MNCSRCGGLIWDFQDDISPRCVACGRRPGPAPTQAELIKAGVVQDTGLGRSREMAGRKGPKGASEYSPHHANLGHPLNRWRR